MKASIILPVILLSTFVIACSKKGETVVSAPVAPAALTERVYSPDSTLAVIKMYCYSCHNPASESHDKIIAPPFAAVKMRYSRVYADRKQFIDSMVSFLQKPTKEKSVMPGPVAKFGVMPKIPLSDKEYTDIAAYMYDRQLEEPIWFKDHMQQMNQ